MPPRHPYRRGDVLQIQFLFSSPGGHKDNCLWAHTSETRRPYFLLRPGYRAARKAMSANRVGCRRLYSFCGTLI